MNADTRNRKIVIMTVKNLSSALKHLGSDMQGSALASLLFFLVANRGNMPIYINHCISWITVYIPIDQ